MQQSELQSLKLHRSLYKQDYKFWNSIHSNIESMNFTTRMLGTDTKVNLMNCVLLQKNESCFYWDFLTFVTEWEKLLWRDKRFKLYLCFRKLCTCTWIFAVFHLSFILLIFLKNCFHRSVFMRRVPNRFKSTSNAISTSDNNGIEFATIRHYYRLQRMYLNVT